VEIGGSPRKRAQDWALEARNVFPFAGDQRSTGVGRLYGLARADALERVERHVRGTPRSVGQTDVERRRNRVVAGLGGIVASRAMAVEDRYSEVVVDALHAGDGDGLVVEDVLPAGDRAARGLRPAPRKIAPRVVRVEDRGRERRRSRVVAADHVVDAEIEGGWGEIGRATVRLRRIELLRVVVECLGREQTKLEIDDRGALRLAQRLRGLSVTEGGSVRLIREIERQWGEADRRVERRLQASRRRGISKGLSPVPHHGAQELKIGGRQWAAKEGEPIRCTGKAVWIVYSGEYELGPARNRQPDADQAFTEEHAVRRLARCDRGHVCERRIRAVVRAEHRVGPACRVEALLEVRRRDRKVVGGVMAARAGATVAAQALKELVARINRIRGSECFRTTGSVGHEQRRRDLGDMLGIRHLCRARSRKE